MGIDGEMAFKVTKVNATGAGEFGLYSSYESLSGSAQGLDLGVVEAGMLRRRMWVGLVVRFINTMT